MDRPDQPAINHGQTRKTRPQALLSAFKINYRRDGASGLNQVDALRGPDETRHDCGTSLVGRGYRSRIAYRGSACHGLTN